MGQITQHRQVRAPFDQTVPSCQSRSGSTKRVHPDNYRTVKALVIEEDTENQGVIPPEPDNDDLFAGSFPPSRPLSPLTTGIDDSIPSKHDLIALLRKNGLPYVLPNQGRDLRSL